MLIAVNYHYVREVFADPFPSIFGVTPKQLRLQLETLGKAGDFVSAEDVRDAVAGSRALPQKAILVTFDDGLREQFDNAWPVLNSIGVPAIFFVNTAPIAGKKISQVHKVHLLRSQIAPRDFIALLQRYAGLLGVNFNLNLNGKMQQALAQYPYDTAENAQLKYSLNVMLREADRKILIDACFDAVFDGLEQKIADQLYMEPEQLKITGAQRCLGTHGHDHVPMAQLPMGEAEEQIRCSLAHLEEWAGWRPFALSYPYGSPEACSEKVGSLAAGLGISFALTMERAGNPDLSRPLQLARFDSNDLPGGSAPKFDLNELFEAVPAAAARYERN